jgi:hypothetical protein
MLYDFVISVPQHILGHMFQKVYIKIPGISWQHGLLIFQQKTLPICFLAQVKTIYGVFSVIRDNGWEVAHA